MSRLTKIDAEREIKRLASAGYRVPDMGATSVAEAWVEHLDGVWQEDVSAAVTAYIRGPDARWPAVGKVLGLAIEARRNRPRRPGQVANLAEAYWAWESHEHDELGKPLGPGMGRGCSQCDAGCPVCGAKMQWQPRLVVVHDEHEHERAGIRWSGSCRAHEEFYAEAERVRQQLARNERIRVAEEEDRVRRAAVERQQVARKVGSLLLEAAREPVGAGV